MEIERVDKDVRYFLDDIDYINHIRRCGLNKTTAIRNRVLAGYYFNNDIIGFVVICMK